MMPTAGPTGPRSVYFLFWMAMATARRCPQRRPDGCRARCTFYFGWRWRRHDGAPSAGPTGAALGVFFCFGWRWPWHDGAPSAGLLCSIKVSKKHDGPTGQILLSTAAGRGEDTRQTHNNQPNKQLNTCLGRVSLKCRGDLARRLFWRIIFQLLRPRPAGKVGFPVPPKGNYAPLALACFASNRAPFCIRSPQVPARRQAGKRCLLVQSCRASCRNTTTDTAPPNRIATVALERERQESRSG